MQHQALSRLLANVSAHRTVLPEARSVRVKARVGTVAFTAGTMVQTRGFKVFGDINVEPDEMFSVIASAPINLTLGDDTGVVTITNND